MSIVNINYACGCRFQCKTVEEAIFHADLSGHEINVLGTVKPSERRVRTRHASSASYTGSVRPQQVAKTPVEVEYERVEAEDFHSLRARLGRS
jgi:hypothetical protein